MWNIVVMIFGVMSAVSCPEINRMRVRCNPDQTIDVVVVGSSAGVSGESVTVKINDDLYPITFVNKHATISGACCHTNATIELVDPPGCLPVQTCGDVEPPDPPGGGTCCLNTGDCELNDNVLSSTGDMDTTECSLPAGVDIVLTGGTWTYNAPILVGTFTCNGICFVNPVGTGDLVLTHLVLNGTLNQVVQSTMEFTSNGGQLDISGNGIFGEFFRIEHEGGNGPNFLGSVNFGNLSVYDITGAFSGAARWWELTNDMSLLNGLFLMEKTTGLNLKTHTLTVKQFRSKGISTISGQSGAKLVVGNGVPEVNISGNISLGAEFLSKGTYIWD